HLPPRSALLPYTTLFRSEFGGAAVGADQTLDIAQRFTSAPIAHRRQMQPFVEYLTRLAGTTSRHRAADVSLVGDRAAESEQFAIDRKSTRLNSSHEWISY